VEEFHADGLGGEDFEELSLGDSVFGDEAFEAGWREEGREEEGRKEGRKGKVSVPANSIQVHSPRQVNKDSRETKGQKRSIVEEIASRLKKMENGFTHM